LPAQPVAAQDVNIARSGWMRAFQIDLHERLRSQRSNDDVARDSFECIRIYALAAGHLPDQAVIKTQLFDLPIANAIGSTIADVADPSAFGANEQRRRGGAHAAEFRVLLAFGVDAGVRFDKGFPQSGNARLGSVLVISVGNDADCQLARQLAHGVRAHAVGDEEDVAAFPPLLGIAGQQGRVGILVMAAPNAYVGQTGVFDGIVADQQQLPHLPHLYVCYSPQSALPSSR